MIEVVLKSGVAAASVLSVIRIGGMVLTSRGETSTEPVAAHIQGVTCLALVTLVSYALNAMGTRLPGSILLLLMAVPGAIVFMMRHHGGSKRSLLSKSARKILLLFLRRFR